MLLTEHEQAPIHEAEENLRIIRSLMERSTKYSTFSGVSGILAGIYAIGGALIQRFALPPASKNQTLFLCNWLAVVALTLATDFFLTKRRAPLVGKTISSQLGKQMILAAGPALGLGVLLTLYFARTARLEDVYPFWMLAYGIAVCAVGLFSQKEVSRLGAAFLVAGAATLLIQMFVPPAVAQELGWVMMAVAFGGFHIVYGIAVSRKGGW